MDRGDNIGGKMDDLIKSLGLINLNPIIDEGFKNEIGQKAAACDYEGCGSEDSWPPIRPMAD
jgi:hypothetical protein